jgi:hypothetical protein
LCLSASEKTAQPGMSLPNVPRAARLKIQPDVKISAASLP